MHEDALDILHLDHTFPLDTTWVLDAGDRNGFSLCTEHGTFRYVVQQGAQPPLNARVAKTSGAWRKHIATTIERMLRADEKKKRASASVEAILGEDNCEHDESIRSKRRSYMLFYSTASRTIVVEPPISLSESCLLYTSPSPRDQRGSRMPSSA